MLTGGLIDPYSVRIFYGKSNRGKKTKMVPRVGRSFTLT